MNNYIKLSMESKSEIAFFSGKKLSKCYRRFYEDDVDETFYEQVDGDVLLVFDDESSLIFQANSEFFSLNYMINPTWNDKEFILISERTFWVDKVGKELSSIELKMSSYSDVPYGVLFHFGNDILEILYQTEGDQDFDFVGIKQG